jgi:glucose-6-phosphate isomerase
MLIALYERVVGLYASLIGINAYHQPGVEAGKKAAGGVIALKQKIAAALRGAPDRAFTVEDLASETGAAGQEEIIFKVLEHLSANRFGGVRKRARKPWHRSTYQFRA